MRHDDWYPVRRVGEQWIEMPPARTYNKAAGREEHLREQDHPESGIELGGVQVDRYESQHSDGRQGDHRVKRMDADDCQVSDRIDAPAAHHGRTSATCPVPESTTTRSSFTRKIRRTDSRRRTIPSGDPSPV